LRIRSLHLTNFRNFADVAVDFSEDRNLIVGANAQGKTNLIEAVHLLGVGRSHRDRKDANLVRFGESYYRVEGVFDHAGSRTVVEVSYDQGRRRIRVNGKETRAAGLIGLVGVVVSSPDDIDLIKGSPSFRRTFLDMAISQSSRDYLVTLQQYVRVLAQRNSWLKACQDKGAFAADTGVWDGRLIESGSSIVGWRLAYLKEIAPLVEEYFGLISGTRVNIELVYETRGYDLGSGSDVGSGLGAALKAQRSLELARGYTALGPHVDDFGFLAGGRDIRQFGSEGDQRTAVLALRCGEIKAMREKLGRYPIVLLDDVFAELDAARAEALTALISEFDQIILSSSRPGPIRDAGMRVMTVTGGRIEQSG
jgi:DNA replication and repair protein RecF